MVCTLLISKQEAEARHKQSVSIDSELSQLFTDVESMTGQTYFLLDYKKELWSWFSFRKKSCTLYSLLYFTGFEYQYINFGPCKLGDSSIGHYVTRQAIAGYLFGVLNGWNHAIKSATAPTSEKDE